MVVTCFRCDEDECDREVEALKKLKERQDHGLTMTEAVKNLSKREIRTPFLLVFSYLLLAMYSGPNVIIFFAVEIFEDVGVGTSGYLAAIVTAGSRVLGKIYWQGIFSQSLFSLIIDSGTLSLSSLVDTSYFMWYCEHTPDQEAAAGEARHGEHDGPGRLHAGAGGRLLLQTV